MNIFDVILLNPLINILVVLIRLTGNLGLAIIALTIILRAALHPLVVSSLKVNKKMIELKPELEKLKVTHKNDKQALMLAQSELYKKHGANPAAGCLPTILQFVVLIGLSSALNLFFHTNAADLISKLNTILYPFNQLASNFSINTHFLYLDLLKPDTFNISGIPFPLPGFFILLATVAQVLSSKMLTPVITAEQKQAKKTSGEMDDAMVAAQQQMIYFLPLTTIILGLRFPSGLILYWCALSLVLIVQQYTIMGWAGLTPWLKRLGLLKSS